MSFGGFGDDNSMDIRGAQQASASGQAVVGDDFGDFCSVGQKQPMTNGSGFGDFSAFTSKPASAMSTDQQSSSASLGFDADFGAFGGTPATSQPLSSMAADSPSSGAFGDFGSFTTSGMNSTMSSHSQPESPATSHKRMSIVGEASNDTFGNFGSFSRGGVGGSASPPSRSPQVLPKLASASESNTGGSFSAAGSADLANGQKSSLSVMSGGDAADFNAMNSVSSGCALFAGPSSATASTAFGSFRDQPAASDFSTIQEVDWNGAKEVEEEQGTAVSAGMTSTTFNTAAGGGNDFGDFGSFNAPTSDAAGFESFGAASSGNAEFGSFGSDTLSLSQPEAAKLAPEVNTVQEPPAPAAAVSSDSFGDFGSFNATPPDAAGTFGSFGAVSSSSDGFGAFGSAAVSSSQPGAEEPADVSTAKNGDAAAAAAAAADDDDDDDFGDFGDFSAAGTSTTPSTSAKTAEAASAQDAGNNDDDFGDFGAFGGGTAASSASASSDAFGAFGGTSTGQSFSAFQTSAPSTTAASDDFGSFGSTGSQASSAFAPAPVAAPAPIAAPLPVVASTPRDKVLSTCFAAVEAAPASAGRQPGSLCSALASGGPWAELGRVGERPLGSFEKTAHRIHGDFLEALKVEASLIGVQSGPHQVPAFAAGLGFLQPSGSPAVNHPVAVSPAGDDPFSLVASGNVSPLDLFGSGGAGSAAARAESVHAFSDALSADAGGSALLDLTFEAMAGGGGTSSRAVVSDPLLQSDLMGLDLTMGAGLVAAVAEDQTASSTLLVAQPSTTSLKPREPTPDMVRMIDSLPDLSFMLSKVLMFPAVLSSLVE